MSDPRSNPPASKSLMRSLGEFVGHIVAGVRSDPARSRRQEVRRTVEETSRDGVVLRRTTIEEIELRQPDRP